MTDLTPVQIIEWFREKARDYDRKADELERDFNIKPTAVKQADPIFQIPPSSGDVERVREFIAAKRSARIADVSKGLGMDEATVRHILTSREDIFVKGEQGWFKVAGE